MNKKISKKEIKKMEKENAFRLVAMNCGFSYTQANFLQKVCFDYPFKGQKSGLNGKIK